MYYDVYWREANSGGLAVTSGKVAESTQND